SDSPQWDNAIRPDSSNTKLVNRIPVMKVDCQPNQYVFVHTRIAESNDTVAGYYTKTRSIYTGETTAIKGISLGYSSLDMKVGDVKLITATPIPSNADNWDGGQWYVNGTGAELYIDEACTTPYYRSIHGYKTELYLKATEKNNDITVGIEKTVGYNSIVRGTMTVNVTDEDGNYKLRQMVFPEVNLHAGESVTVDISTYPNPSIIEGVQSIIYSNMPNDIVVTIYAKTKTARITANPGTPVGNYSCGVYIDGQQTTIPSFIKINVIDDEIPVESISVEPAEVTLAPGMSYKFNLTVNPANACVSDTVKWEYVSGSSNITVDGTGTVKVADDANGGISTVFKASYGGKSTTFKVNVATSVESVSVDLTKPEAGELPSAPTLVTTDGVNPNSLTYKWYSTWDTYTEMNTATDCFEPGKTYRLCMELDAKEGYIFTNTAVVQLGIAGGVDTCVVNNNTVTRLYFYKDFTIPNTEISFMLGDVNLDGKISIDDATLIQKYLAGVQEFDDEAQSLAADVNGSGDISIDDTTLIQKYIAGLVEKF
ncbi:MAG: dockerin type I domain-containing protein, partial [Acutalibacteraceae bacterium]